MKKISTISILIGFFISSFGSPIIPTGNNNNLLYYRIGGAQDYALPPVQNSNTINLNAGADLGLGNQCGMYNPALSIQNTLNNLQNNVNNLTQTILTSATGSIAEMPMYFLAQANPTLYNLLNNALLSAHTAIDTSVKSCQAVKDQIAQGKNPYQDWGTISIGDSWKQHLSLTAAGQEDVNDAKATIDQTAGNDGVAWVQGKAQGDGSLRAGGQSQPPIHAIADTVRAGYNAMLNRTLADGSNAPSDSSLANQFATPQDAANWTTTVLGDQIITTCNDANCKSNQGGVAGRGLLPLATVCTPQNQNDCVDNLRTKLQNLVLGNTPMTKENLNAVSADNLVVSPQVINAIKGMDSSQQGIFINKLAQEVAAQRLMDKALTARDLLQTGSQVPVIASNAPAQKILQRSIQQLDQNIQAISFSAQVRQQMMSNTVVNILNYATQQQHDAFDVGKINNQESLIENSAIPASPGAKP